MAFDNESGSSERAFLTLLLVGFQPPGKIETLPGKKSRVVVFADSNNHHSSSSSSSSRAPSSRLVYSSFNHKVEVERWCEVMGAHARLQPVAYGPGKTIVLGTISPVALHRNPTYASCELWRVSSPEACPELATFLWHCTLHPGSQDPSILQTGQWHSACSRMRDDFQLEHSCSTYRSSQRMVLKQRGCAWKVVLLTPPTPASSTPTSSTPASSTPASSAPPSFACPDEGPCSDWEQELEMAHRVSHLGLGPELQSGTIYDGVLGVMCMEWIPFTLDRLLRHKPLVPRWSAEELRRVQRCARALASRLAASQILLLDFKPPNIATRVCREDCTLQLYALDFGAPWAFVADPEFTPDMLRDTMCCMLAASTYREYDLFLPPSPLLSDEALRAVERVLSLNSYDGWYILGHYLHTTGACEKTRTWLWTYCGTSPARGRTYTLGCENCKGNGCSGDNCNQNTRWVGGAHVTTNGQHDWLYKLEQCSTTCNPRPWYTPVDDEICNIGLDAFNQEPLVETEWLLSSDSPQVSPLVRCFYDPLKITREQQVQRWNFLFPGQDPQTNLMMRFFCSQVQTYLPPHRSECLQDPDTGEQAYQCTRLRSSAAGSEQCNTWFTTQQDPAGQDAFITRVAGFRSTLATDLPENSCSNRAFDPIYQQVNFGFPFSDGCWYVPCRNPEFNLVASSVRPEKGECPSTVCSQIIAIGSANNIDLSDISFSIDCNFNDAAARTYACEPVPDSTSGERRCVFAGCDPDEPGCFENDATCGGECSTATTYRCVRGSCEPQLCDPETDISCFQASNCNNSCNTTGSTWRYLNHSCFPGQCSPVDNVVCFSENTCGGLLVPKQELSPALLMLVIIGSVLLVIVIAVGAWREQRKRRGQPKARRMFSLAPAAGSSPAPAQTLPPPPRR